MSLVIQTKNLSIVFGDEKTPLFFFWTHRCKFSKPPIFAVNETPWSSNHKWWVVDSFRFSAGPEGTFRPWCCKAFKAVVLPYLSLGSIGFRCHVHLRVVFFSMFLSLFLQIFLDPNKSKSSGSMYLFQLVSTCFKHRERGCSLETKRHQNSIVWSPYTKYPNAGGLPENPRDSQFNSVSE